MKRTLLCFILMFIMFLSACSTLRENGGNNTAISPYSSSASYVEKNLVIYFYSEQYECLTAVQLEDKIPVEKQKEEFILEKLIAGPSANPYLIPIINSKTKVINISKSDKTLTVTFSKEFLTLSSSGNKSTDKNLIKKMSIYSVVNSLTECGNYDRVQILVDVKGTGIGERIKRSEAGFAGENENEFLEALSRNNEVILLPKSAVIKAFNLLEIKDWSSLYNLIESSERPDYDLFISICNSQINNLTNYELSDGTVSPNGQTAVVTATFTISGISSTNKYVNIPVKLYRSNNIWKLSYSLFDLYLLRG